MAANRSHRRSWRDKLEHTVPGLPKVVDVPERWRKMMGGRRVLVPTPLMADAEIRAVGRGRLLSVGQLRRRLAAAAHADSTCPLTLGIFLRIISEAAEEDRRAGRAVVTPWWRVVKDDGALNPKMAGGVAAQAAHLRAEGHRIARGAGRRPPRVADYRQALG